MVRQISANSLAQLAQTHGGEPITLLQIDWQDEATPKWYGDRSIESENVPGKILQVGTLDNVVGISNNNSSQQITVTLDDVDGSIKAIFDNTDIHKRTARVYQWFDGLDFSDKFLLFAGKISSPIIWDERARSVEFTIISQLEDKEVGFSPEEGQFEWLPSAMVGKPWPMIFGTVVESPALQMNDAVTGTTLCGVGVIAGLDYLSSTPLFSNGSNADLSIYKTLAQITNQINHLECVRFCWYFSSLDKKKATAALEQINDLRGQSHAVIEQEARKAACVHWQRQKQIADANSKGLGCNPIRILGGEDFLQGVTLVIEINGALFTGYFSGQNFYIERRIWQDGENEARSQSDDLSETCPFSQSQSGFILTRFDYRTPVPCGSGNLGFNTCECRTYGYISSAVGRVSRTSDNSISQQFWAEPGATVRMYGSEPITYIVAALYTYNPGTVLAVKAYKEFPGERRLVDVPSSYYTIRNVDYGTLKTVQIVTHRPLSSYSEQGWTNDLYVTFRSHSAVGPDMIDTLIYIIDHFTDLTYDYDSFEDARIKLEPFPVNFPVLERKNTVQILQEIAFQARCALWLSNGKFYIKYLPEEPGSVDTITVSDIDAERGVQTELTTTEDLVTKMKIGWRMRWSPGITDREKDKSEQTIILRHNVNRYGIQSEDFDWYIYNQPDIIYKAATFWLIQKSNSWKRIRFSTFLNKLNLETFDCVTLNFSQGYVANGAIKALVEEATYNSETNLIDFVCIVPVKAGQMEKYDWFWPAGLSFSLTWPPPDEIAAGDAGGGGEGMDASGALPIGFFENWGDDIVIVGGPNVVYRQQSDWGDRHPTDVGFSAQDIGAPVNYAEISGVSKPRLNLRMFLAEDSNPESPPDFVPGISIDIRETRITDSKKYPGKETRLTDLFRGMSEDDGGGIRLVVKENVRISDKENLDEPGRLTDLIRLTEGEDKGTLALKKDLLVADDDHPEGAEFDFKWADEYELWAAGTAFLRDEDS